MPVAQVSLVDVSNNNGRVDWAAVAGAGVKGAFCKVTEGSGFVDKFWRGPSQSHRDETAAVGMRRGGYHFGRPGDAAAQARFFIDHLGGPTDLPLILDLENPPKGARQWRDPGEATDFALGFHSELDTLMPNHPQMTYTFQSFTLRLDPLLTMRPLWLANYRTTPPPPKAPWKGYAVWQHTDAAHIAGIPNPSTGCDHNWANADWWDSLSSPAPSPPETDMAPQPLFIQGDADPHVYRTDVEFTMLRWITSVDNLKLEANLLALQGTPPKDDPSYNHSLGLPVATLPQAFVNGLRDGLRYVSEPDTAEGGGATAAEVADEFAKRLAQ